MIASIVSAVAGFLGPILTARKDTMAMARSAIVISTIVNVVLNVIFAYMFGVQGVAVATMISGFVMFAIRYHASQEEVGVSYFLKFIVSCVLLLINAVASIFIENFLWRMIVFSAVAWVLVIIIWRQDVLAQLRKVAGSIRQIKNKGE